MKITLLRHLPRALKWLLALSLLTAPTALFSSGCWKNVGPALCAEQGAPCGDYPHCARGLIMHTLCRNCNPGTVKTTVYRDVSQAAGPYEAGYTNEGTPIPCVYTCTATCPSCNNVQYETNKTGAGSQMPWGDCCIG